MPSINFDITGDNKKLVEAFEQANKIIDGFLEKTKQRGDVLDKNVEELGKKAGITKDALNNLDDAVNDNTKEYKSMKAEMLDLVQKMAKARIAGEESSAQYREWAQRAGELQDAIGDAREEIKGMASDTRGLDVALGAANVMAGGFSTAVGAMEMFGASTKDAEEAQKTLQSAMAITTGLQSVQNNLQSQSALMTSIATVQIYAKAKAEAYERLIAIKGTAATIGMTIAQSAFNTVAKANPYVVLAAALVSIVGAVWAYTKHTKEATKAEAEHQKQLEKSAAAQKKLAEEQKKIAASAAKTTASFVKLQTEWKNLKTVGEKKQWIKDNQSAFDALGISINKVGTAEKVFSSQTNIFAQAMAARAIAAAKAAQAVEKYTEYVENRKDKKWWQLKAGDDYSRLSEKEKASLNEAGFKSDNGKLSASAAKWLNSWRKRKADEVNQQNDQKEKELKNSIVKATEDELKANQEIAKLGDKKVNSQEAKAANDKLKKELEEREKLNKELIALAQQNVDDSIKTREDGTAKEIAEINNDYNKKVEALEKTKADWIKRNKENNMLGLISEGDSKGLTEKQAKEINAALDIAAQEHSQREAAIKATARKKEHDAQLAYLKEYGSIEAQRLAITEETEQKIEELKQAGANDWEIASVAEQAKAQLEKINAEDVFKKINWNVVFSDLQGHSREYLTSLRDELLAVLNDGSLKSIEDIETVQAKINEINAEIGKKGGLFNFQGSKAVENQLRKEEEKQAKENAEKAKQEEKELEKKVETLKAVGAEDSAIRIAEEQLRKAREATAAATKKAQQAEDNARRSSAQAVADWFSDAQEFIAEQSIDQLPDFLENIGLGDIGEKLGKGLSGFNNAAGAAADFANNNFLGAATKTISAIKDFGSALGIGGGNAAEVNKLTEENNQAIKTLTDRIGLLTDAIDKNTGASAVAAGKAAVEAQKAINDKAMETLEAQMKYHSAHNSNAYYLNDDDLRKAYAKERKYAETASGTTLQSVRSLNDIYKLTPEQIAAIKTYMPETWEILTKSGKYDKTEYWDAVVDQAGKLEGITAKVKENITQWSLSGLKDEFRSTLLDMDSDIDAFAENLQKKTADALLNIKLNEGNNSINKQLEKWYDNYYEILSDETLSEDEYQRRLNEAQKEYQKIVNEGLKLKDDVAKITGYGTSASQQATANGIKSITADQADQLVGRITAMQIAVESSRTTREDMAERMATGVDYLLRLSVTGAQANETLNAMLLQHVQSNSYLEDMVKYNKAMYQEWSEDINQMRRSLERL